MGPQLASKGEDARCTHGSLKVPTPVDDVADNLKNRGGNPLTSGSA